MSDSNHDQDDFPPIDPFASDDDLFDLDGDDSMTINPLDPPGPESDPFAPQPAGLDAPPGFPPPDFPVAGDGADLSLSDMPEASGFDVSPEVQRESFEPSEGLSLSGEPSESDSSQPQPALPQTEGPSGSGPEDFLDLGSSIEGDDVFGLPGEDVHGVPGEDIYAAGPEAPVHDIYAQDQELPVGDIYAAGPEAHGYETQGQDVYAQDHEVQGEDSAPGVDFGGSDVYGTEAPGLDPGAADVHAEEAPMLDLAGDAGQAAPGASLELSMPDSAPLDLAEGNRPASGARHIAPGEAFSSDFLQGLDSSESAGDFLGLDTDLVEEVEKAGVDMGFDTETSYEDPLSPPTPLMDPGLDSEGLDPPEALGDADPLLDEGFDSGDYGEEMEEDEEFVESGSRSSSRLFVLAFGIGLIAVLGVMFGPGLFSGSEPEAPQVVTPSGSSGKRPTVVSTAGQPNAGADPTSGQPGVTSTDPGGIEQFARGDGDFKLESLFIPFTLGEGGADDLAAFETVPVPGESFDPLTGDPLGLDPVTGSDPLMPDSTGLDMRPQVTSTDTSSEFQGLSAEGAEFDGSVFEENLNWVDGENVDMLYRGSMVPMQAVFAPTKVHVPNVGFVRVHMESGEVFEGRLVAVGKSRVWVDTEPGQVGLDGDRVTRIEQLLGNVDAVAAGDVSPVKGKKVRAVVPGGVIYGRVLSVQGELVTLATEDGGRITVMSPMLEEAKSSRAVLIR